MVLFPSIVRMEEAAIQKEPIVPAPFGTVQNPVSMMEHEHDSAGNWLRAMRKANEVSTAPADSPRVSYQTLYKALAAFEAPPHPSYSPRKQHPVSAGDRDGKGALTDSQPARHTCRSGYDCRMLANRRLPCALWLSSLFSSSC